MLFSIEASSPVPIYAQVVAQVRAAIAAGELRAGDALPSVRQLAAELRVNPNTVAQAYRELEHEGLTYVQRGQGTFVAEVGPERLAGERAQVARALVERMLHEAFRLGLTPAEVRDTVDGCLAALPGGGACAAPVPADPPSSTPFPFT
jgi:GntR family transcriptional regulator